MTAHCLLEALRFINNEWVHGKDGKTFETINPTTEKPICSVAEATEKDVDIAVAAARKAFEGEWRRTTPQTRGRLLVKLADLIERDAEILASIEALDNGKAKSTALSSDVPMASGCLRYYGGWADKIEGKVIDTNENTFAYTVAEPVRASCALSHSTGARFRAQYRRSSGLTCISDWRLRTDHSLELPTAHVVMEDWPGCCYG